MDVESSRAVVVETADLVGLPPATIMRVRNEAATLRQIGSAFLATPRDIVVEGEQLHVVFDRLELGTLAEALQRTGRLTRSHWLIVARTLLQALSDLHQYGLVHTAVRPEHIFLADQDRGGGGAVLGGFGVSRLAQLFGPGTEEPISVLRYLSPEQAGLISRMVDERSDLYSLGLVLFEALAGRPALAAETRRDLLRQHLSASPPPIRSLGVDVPRILDDFLARLLRKDSSERYQSAAAALEDLDAILSAFEHDQTEPPIVLGASDRRRSLIQPVLVGRENELGGLEAHVDRAELGHGGVVVLTGKSGDGKTRLLDELTLRSVARGVRVFRGQALDRVGSGPFAAFAGVVRDIGSAVRADPIFGEQLRDQLGDRLHAAAQALPELGEILSAGGGPGPGPEAHGENRSIDALASLLDGLGSRDRPVLVLLDDCQSADELTIRLLAHWHRSKQERRRHTIVVTAFRSEGDAPEQAPAFLRGVPKEARIQLTPLSPDDIHRLVESMAGPVPDAVPELVTSLAQGSPFMATAMMRGLVESGVLVPGQTGWALDASGLDQVQSSRQAADLLSRRVDLLPDAAAALLCVGALLGREFDIEFAARLAGLPLNEAVEGAAEAQRRHLVWTTNGASRASFIHDRVRETFLARTSEDERRELHRRAALALDTAGDARSFDLAYHFDAAGEHGLAFPHALAAAEQARSQYSLVLAEEYYRVALRGAPGQEPDVRRRASEGLGEVLMLRGAYTEAAQRFAEALEQAGDFVEQARIEGRLGDLAFKQTEPEQATEWIGRALTRLGQPVPWGQWTNLGLAGRELGIFAGGQLGRRSSRGRQGPADTGAVDLLAGHLYGRLTYASWVQGRILPCLFATVRHVNLARHHEPSPTLGQAWSDLGVMASVASPWWWRRGAAFLDRSLEVRRSLDDIWGEGQSLHFYGVVLHAGGQYRAAIERCEAAVPLLERTGDRWELNSARWHMALCRYRLGELAEARREAERVRSEGLEIGDDLAVAAAVDIIARTTGGNVPAQIITPLLERVEQRPGDLQTTVPVLLAEGVRLINTGHPTDAATRFREASTLAGRARSVYAAPAYAWLATASRLAVAERSPFAPRVRRAAIRQAAGAARRSLWQARRFGNELPHALREAGLTAAMRGQGRRARRLLNRGLVAAQRTGARHEEELTRRAWAEVGLALGWEGAAEARAEAEAALARMAGDGTGGDPSGLAWLSLSDRLDALLEAGRRITSVESADGVMAALRDAAFTTLRADRCVVLAIPDDGDLDDAIVVAGRQDDLPWSPALVQQAADTGRPVSFAEGDQLPTRSGPADEAALVGVRSAVCAPVIVGARVAACIYAVHDQVAGLFGNDECDLLEFIASLAGAAREREQLQRDVMARVIAAQEAERARVARDLHDEIGQALTSVLLALRLVHESLAERPDEAAEHAARVRELVSDALQRARGLAFELRPAVLDNLGLTAALRRLAREYSERHGLAVDVEVSGLDQERLPAEIDTAVYRVTQEALTNVVRHAAVEACRITVARSGPRLRATIEDRGRGFDSGRLPTDSFGLRGMAERAGLVGAALTVDSVPGEGTVIVLEVPLP